MVVSNSFNKTLLERYKTIIADRQSSNIVHIDGHNLSIGALLAICRDKSKVEVDPNSLSKIEKSVEILTETIARGESIYGVTTGFGGSADVSTRSYQELQENLIDFVNVGLAVNSLKILSVGLWLLEQIQMYWDIRH